MGATAAFPPLPATVNGPMTFFAQSSPHDWYEYVNELWLSYIYCVSLTAKLLSNNGKFCQFNGQGVLTSGG